MGGSVIRTSGAPHSLKNDAEKRSVRSIKVRIQKKEVKAICSVKRRQGGEQAA